MIDSRNMNCDEFADLMYDIRDGKIKFEDVIWSDLNDMSNNSSKKHHHESKFRKGDIITLNNDYFVVVDNVDNNNVYFITKVDSYISYEMNNTNYSISDSGWETLSDDIDIIGHIIMNQEGHECVYYKKGLRSFMQSTTHRRAL